MESPDSEKFVFNETEMERLMALTGTHGVLYDGVVWRVTVEMLSLDIVTFTLTPQNFIPNAESPISFFHYKGTGKLTFVFGDKWDLSFVRAFLNGYIPCDLEKFRR